MPLKSTIKQLKPLDTEVSVTIDHLHADKNIIDAHHKHLTNIYKNDQPEQINRRINEIIARDNLFNAVMNETAKCFEVTYDQDELKQVMTNIKPNFEGRDDTFLKSVAEKIIAKTLIFAELKKL
ncbi:hypothetical protein FACS1894166_03670 [Bacilli bacterium]|nr:hypothetical protein FACS1894166_03670 [Bacilli bacterium]